MPSHSATTRGLFHLAIPALDLERTAFFYQDLGAIIGRKYETHVVMNFYGHQVVLHKVDSIDQDPKMYPRHFGVIFESSIPFYNLVYKYQHSPNVYAKCSTRNYGLPEEHKMFFLKDPSNNLVEFKWYKNRDAV